MTLDSSGQQKVMQWLQVNHIRTDCPACGQQANWQPGPVISPVIYNPGAPTLRGAAPLVPVACSNCTYVMWFAATPIGLVP